MSINWVMLSSTTPPTFTPLAHETTLYTSPPRTTLLLHSLNKYPGQDPFSVSSSTGTLFLTNRRIIYLPTTPSPQLQSFAVPILNTHDSHVAAPWIGPNVWTALVQPVQGGGIPAHHAALECKVTFKEGGAYDFHGRYERVKERLQQQVEVARESGRVVGDGSEVGRGTGGGALSGVDVGNVHLEDLPAYEETAAAPQPQPQSQSQPPPPPPPPSGIVVESAADTPAVLEEAGARVGSSSVAPVVEGGVGRASFDPPAEPPPGYEEVQRETVQDELERRLSGGHQQR